MRLAIHGPVCSCSGWLQFPEVFWDAEVDYFGVTQPAGPASRGRCFMFWNLARFNGGTPLLAGLVAGAAARAAEQDSQEELVEHTLQVCGVGGV